MQLAAGFLKLRDLSQFHRHYEHRCICTNCTAVSNSVGPVTCTNASNSQVSACKKNYALQAGPPSVCNCMSHYIIDGSRSCSVCPVFPAVDARVSLYVSTHNDGRVFFALSIAPWVPECPIVLYELLVYHYTFCSASKASMDFVLLYVTPSAAHLNIVLNATASGEQWLRIAN